MDNKVISKLSEAYKTNGHEDTKEHAAKLEQQRKEADAQFNKLVEQRDPLALLLKGFMEQGKQNDKRNETKIDFYKGENGKGHNSKAQGEDAVSDLMAKLDAIETKLLSGKTDAAEAIKLKGQLEAISAELAKYKPE